MANLNVHGYLVNYSDSSKEGVNYLSNIGYDSAMAIFNKAIENGSTSFEYEGGGYKLAWNGESNYTISKKY